ncbi:hypothetical protein A3715_16915 [Oleiphilus sp. HI0009]|uniref:DUF4156 domain-containing protein n=1 Tax=unclassified Oleiphilus TaxID=2631174 RepID=UPI0007C3F2C0
MQFTPKRILTSIAPAFILSITLVGCSFVDTVPGSQKVIISHDTAECKRIGETEVKVLSSIAGIDRDEDTMAQELSTLARNAAYSKKANTITPISEIEDGRQTFVLYRCR